MISPRLHGFIHLKPNTTFILFLRCFITFVENQLSFKIKTFQSDGMKFVNSRVKTLLQKHEIFHQISCPYTPQQNGQVEQKNHHIVETGLAMMFHGHILAQYWVHAFSSAMYTINRLPTKVLSIKSMFEMLFNRVPAYDIFHPFGCQGLFVSS